MNKKVWLAILLILLGGGLGGGLVWLWDNYEIKQKGEMMTVASPSPETEAELEADRPAASVLPETEEGVYGDWLSYSNPKYSYGFRYDGDWSLNDAMPGSDQYDRVVVQGDISTKGWPSIEIGLGQPATTLTELKTELESLFGSEMMIEEAAFAKGMISAVKLSSAASPMAYASETYYFLHKGVVLKIGLNDTTAAEAKAVYDNFLSEFEVF